MSVYQFAPDKTQHIIYGALIAAATVLVLAAWNLAQMWLPDLPRLPRGLIPFAAFAASFLVGWAYERWQQIQNDRASARDLPPPHLVEVKDFQHTGYGGALVAIPVLLGMLA